MNRITKFKAKVVKSDAIKSSTWIAAGMVVGQCLRLLLNLGLTRLLAPEFFGLMAIVYALTGFFGMMSDIGLFPSIVNSKRDNDPAFMQTAWTIQVIRSLLISLALMLAAYPMSVFYSEPVLFPVILAVSLSFIFSGFNSIALKIEEKYLRQKKIVIVNIGIQVIMSIAVFLIAYYTKSIWSLVFGNLISVVLQFVSSYLLFGPHYSKFRLEKEATGEIIHFGKWILLSSFFGYLANQAAPLIIAGFVSSAELGIYTIGLMLASSAGLISTNLSQKVIFPKFRKILENRDEAAYRRLLSLRERFVTMFAMIPLSLAIIGDWLVNVLYDERYEQAGWVLRMLAVGAIGKLLITSAQPVLLALRDSRLLLINQFLVASIRVGCLVILGHFYRFDGIVLAGAVASYFEYVIVVVNLRKYKVNILKKDVKLLLFCGATIALSWALLGIHR